MNQTSLLNSSATTTTAAPLSDEKEKQYFGGESLLPSAESENVKLSQKLQAALKCLSH